MFDLSGSPFRIPLWGMVNLIHFNTFSEWGRGCPDQARKMRAEHGDSPTSYPATERSDTGLHLLQRNVTPTVYAIEHGWQNGDANDHMRTCSYTSLSLSVCIYVCVYIYIYIYVCTHIYIYHREIIYIYVIYIYLFIHTLCVYQYIYI